MLAYWHSKLGNRYRAQQQLFRAARRAVAGLRSLRGPRTLRRRCCAPPVLGAGGATLPRTCPAAPKTRSRTTGTSAGETQKRTSERFLVGAGGEASGRARHTRAPSAPRDAVPQEQRGGAQGGRRRRQRRRPAQLSLALCLLHHVLHAGGRLRAAQPRGVRRGAPPVSHMRMGAWGVELRAARRKAGSSRGFEVGVAGAAAAWVGGGGGSTRQGGRRVRHVACGRRWERMAAEGDAVPPLSSFEVRPWSTPALPSGRLSRRLPPHVQPLFGFPRGSLSPLPDIKVPPDYFTHGQGKQLVDAMVRAQEQQQQQGAAAHAAMAAPPLQPLPWPADAGEEGGGARAPARASRPARAHERRAGRGERAHCCKWPHPPCMRAHRPGGGGEGGARHRRRRQRRRPGRQPGTSASRQPRTAPT